MDTPYRCRSCGHVWYQHEKERDTDCPKCKSVNTSPTTPEKH